MNVRSLVAALASMLLLTVTAVQSQGLSREQAVQSLSHADAQTRRDAASRLGEVGSMADVTLLVRAPCAIRS